MRPRRTAARPPEQSQIENKDKTTSDSKADFVLAADTFLDEFVTDSKAADAKYKGKVVEITGRVHDLVNREVFKLGRVKSKKTLIGEISVRCGVHPPQEPIVGRLSLDQQVKMVGKYSDYEDNLGPGVGGIVTELEPTKIVTVNAAELAKEVKSDRDKAAEKYGKTSFIVKGKLIDKLETTQTETIAGVTLAGADETNIRIQVPGLWIEYLGKHKVGSIVEVRVHHFREHIGLNFLTSNQPKANELTFDPGMVLPAK